MIPQLTRRRFLSISAAAFATAGTGMASAAPVARWGGIALGASASLQLAGISLGEAEPIFADIRRELDRLEAIFSLYRSDSEIMRLNASGKLEAPSADLLAVLSTCASLRGATEGAFDPTVQPLFSAVAHAAGKGRSPSPDEIAAARSLVGWDGVSFDTTAVTLARKGAALTLNGIAQGYVTDRIAALLRAHGLTDILVDMGEVAAMGRNAGGELWRAGIADPAGTVLKRLVLTDRALATSSPKGTLLSREDETGHIFDPASGGEASARALVAVSARRAELADGLSTALCVTPADRSDAVLRRFPEARIELAI